MQNSIKTGVHIVIDYYRATFEFRCSNDDNELEDVNSLVDSLCNYLSFNETEKVEMTFGKGRYKYLYKLGMDIDLYIKGPKNVYGIPTCSLELKGKGCREFERRNPDKTWYDFLLCLVSFYDATATRVDIAIDDYDGDIASFKWIQNKLDNKEYITTFKRKYYKIHGCEEEGYSLEFGSRTSSQMLVIYQKDKEQLHKNGICMQDYWTRFEMRFMHDKANRVIHDIIEAYYVSEEKFKSYVFGIFYTMLDIKENSNYNDKNIYKEKTDPNWIKFLSYVEKATITKPSARQLQWEKFNMYIRQSLAKYLLIKYVIGKQSLPQLNKEMLYELLNGLDKIIDDKNKINQINVYLHDNNVEMIDVDDIKDIKETLILEYEDTEVPF